jgi:hypothetical protein
MFKVELSSTAGNTNFNHYCNLILELKLIGVPQELPTACPKKRLSNFGLILSENCCINMGRKLLYQNGTKTDVSQRYEKL